MEFNLLSTQNWSRAFSISIEGIQVTFQPVVEFERALIRGGFLRKVRGLSKASAVLVSLFFTIHCTSPRLEPRPRTGTAQMEAGFADGFTEIGAASWYGSEEDGFAGKATASGEVFDPSQLTCAHRTLPLGSLIHIENLENGRKVMLRVNDRGPFARGRILDVSRRGATELGFLGQGVARVKLKAVNPDGSPILLQAPDPENPFTVQVAALKEPLNVERLSRALQDAFGSVDIQEVSTRDGQTIKRVRVGSFSRMEDAQKAAEEIAKRLGDRGVEPFILRRR